MTMNDGSDKVLNYYQKYSQNSNLPKYFSGSSIQCLPDANANITGDSNNRNRPIQVPEIRLNVNTQLSHNKSNKATCMQTKSANNSPECLTETPFQNYLKDTMESDSKEDIRYIQNNTETNLRKCVSLPDISISKDPTFDVFVPKLNTKVDRIVEVSGRDSHTLNQEESTGSNSLCMSSNNNKHISSYPSSSHLTISSSINTHPDVLSQVCPTSSSCSESEDSKILEFRRTLSYLKAKIGLPDAQSTPYIHLNETKKKHVSKLTMKSDSKVCTLDHPFIISKVIKKDVTNQVKNKSLISHKNPISLMEFKNVKCIQQHNKPKLKLSISTPVCIDWTCPKSIASNSSRALSTVYSKTVQTEVSAKDNFQDNLVFPSQVYSKTIQTELKDCLGGSSTVYSKTIQTELLAEDNLVCAMVGPRNMFSQTGQMENINEENIKSIKSHEKQSQILDKSQLTSSSENVPSDIFEDNFNCLSKCGSFEYIDGKAALSGSSKEENSSHISKSKVCKSSDISDILNHYSDPTLSSKDSQSEITNIENHVKLLQQLLNTTKLELNKKKYYIRSLIKGITDFDLFDVSYSNPDQDNIPKMPPTEPKQIISSCAILQETNLQKDFKYKVDKCKMPGKMSEETLSFHTPTEESILYSSNSQSKQEEVLEKINKNTFKESKSDLILKKNDLEDDEHLLEFVKNEKAYQINWIDKEISHLTKLKTVLESKTTCKNRGNEKTSQPIIPPKTSVYKILQTDGTKINSEREYVIQQTVDIKTGQKINYDLDGQKYSVINSKNPQTLSESTLDLNKGPNKSVCAEIKIKSEKNHTNIKVSQLCNVCQQVSCSCQSDFPENINFQEKNIYTQSGTQPNDSPSDSPSYDNPMNCLLCQKFQCRFHNSEIAKPIFHTSSCLTSASADRFNYLKPRNGKGLTSVDVGQNTFNSLEKIFHKCYCTSQEKKCNCKFVNSLYRRFSSHDNKHSAKDVSCWDYTNKDEENQTSCLVHKCHEHILKNKYITNSDKPNYHVKTQTSRDVLPCNCFKSTQTLETNKEIKQSLDTEGNDIILFKSSNIISTNKNGDYTQYLPNNGTTKALTSTDLQPSTQPVKSPLEEEKHLKVTAPQPGKLPLENKNVNKKILSRLGEDKINKEIGIQSKTILHSKSLQTSLELSNEPTKEVGTKITHSKFIQVESKNGKDIGIQAEAILEDKSLQTSLEQIDNHKSLNEPNQNIYIKDNKSKGMQVEYTNVKEIGNQAEDFYRDKSLQISLEQDKSVGNQAEDFLEDKSLQVSLEQNKSSKLINESTKSNNTKSNQSKFIQANFKDGMEIGVQSNITFKSNKGIGIQADRTLKSKSLQTFSNSNKNKFVENIGSDPTNKIAKDVKTKYINSKYTQIKSTKDHGVQVYYPNPKSESSQTTENLEKSTLLPEFKDNSSILNAPADDDKTNKYISKKTHMKPERNKEIGVQVDVGFQSKYIQTSKDLENNFVQNKEKSHTKKVGTFNAGVNTKKDQPIFNEPIDNYGKINKDNKIKSDANTQGSPSIQEVTSTDKTTSDEMTADFKNSKSLGSSTLTSDQSRIITPLFKITCIFCKKNLNVDEISKIPNLHSLYAVCKRCFSNEPNYSVSAVKNQYGFLRVGQGTIHSKCCHCCQPKPRKTLVIPKEVAYTLTIKSHNSGENKRRAYDKNKNGFKSYKSLDRKRKKNQEDYQKSDTKENSVNNRIHHTKHDKNYPLHEKDSSNAGENEYALTEYLIVNRPEFICSAEARRQKVLQSKILRVQQTDHLKLNFLENKLNELPPREINKVFTEREMKTLNRRTRQNLPEVQNKLFDARNRRLKDAEKLICNVFSKKVQQSVLRGKPTFSIESSIT